MKLFRRSQTREAIHYAIDGGQALQPFIKTSVFCGGCGNFFKYPQRAARLFDQDYKRLVETIKSFGINSVHVHLEGQDKQHVDVVGKPLERAMRACDE